MSNEEAELTPGERELQAALGRLSPARPAIDVRQLATLALLRRERRRTRWWQVAAAGLALAATGTMVLKPGPRTVEKIVYLDASPVSPVAAVEPSSATTLVRADFAYLRLRERVMTFGVDTLSRSPAAADAEPSVRVRAATPALPQTPWYLDMLAGGRS